jgi:hypothetical protein
MEGKKDTYKKNTHKPLVQGRRFPDKTNWGQKTLKEVHVKQWWE